MKAFAIIKKLISTQVINTSYATLNKMNKEYTKSNDKDVIKGYMEGVLVNTTISVISKETSKSSSKEFMDKLK